MEKTDKKVFMLNVKDYKKLESLLFSWWDSLPEEMQQEFRERYRERGCGDG